MESDTLCTSNVRKYSNLKECWVNSLACKMAEKCDVGDIPFNCGCIARDKRSLPEDFYEQIKTQTL